VRYLGEKFLLESPRKERFLVATLPRNDRLPHSCTLLGFLQKTSLSGGRTASRTRCLLRHRHTIL
jgi:hypothetical protein